MITPSSGSYSYLLRLPTGTSTTTFTSSGASSPVGRVSRSTFISFIYRPPELGGVNPRTGSYRHRLTPPSELPRAIAAETQQDQMLRERMRRSQIKKLNFNLTSVASYMVLR